MAKVADDAQISPCPLLAVSLAFQLFGDQANATTKWPFSLSAQQCKTAIVRFDGHVCCSFPPPDGTEPKTMSNGRILRVVQQALP